MTADRAHAQALDALLREAEARHRKGELAVAGEAYEAILARDPEHFDALRLLSVVWLQRGRPGEAEPLARRALAQRSDSAVAHYNLGNALTDLGRWTEAVEAFDRAVELDPGFASARLRRGLTLQRLGRHRAALADFDAAAALLPKDAAAHFHRGVALLHLDEPKAALEPFEATLALAPENADAHNNRATALLDLGRFGEALEALEAALRLRPGDPQLISHRAQALARLGRSEEALTVLDALIAERPEHHDAHWRRSLLRLARGDYAGGWADYEHRWRAEAFVRGSAGEMTPDLRARIDPDLTREAQARPPHLAVGEQGVGDVIMFASMVSDLQADAAAVTLLVEPRLVRLFRSSFPGATVIDPRSAQAEPPAADLVVPLGSLARLYRSGAEDFPGRPYLTAAPEVRERWMERLRPMTGRLRVGISWRGGVLRTGRNDRSLSLEELRPVLETPGCEFVSLQYGEVAEGVAAANATLSRPIRHFARQEIDDFEDLAGLVQGLDVVVSVQTALVHLSGGLGARCLAMLPFRPEWRYAPSASRMPWYEAVELVAQPRPDDWGSVIEQVSRRLRELAGD